MQATKFLHLLTAALLAMAFTAVMAQSPDTSAKTWVARCSVDAPPVEQAQCDAYVGGLLDMHSYIEYLAKTEPGAHETRIWCLPKNATVLQVRAIIVERLSRHPAELHGHFWSLAAKALKEAFPCESS